MDAAKIFTKSLKIKVDIRVILLYYICNTCVINSPRGCQNAYISGKSITAKRRKKCIIISRDGLQKRVTTALL